MVPAAGSFVSARKATGCAQWANRESIDGVPGTPTTSQHSAALGCKQAVSAPVPAEVRGWGACCMQRALWVLLGYAFSVGWKCGGV